MFPRQWRCSAVVIGAAVTVLLHGSVALAELPPLPDPGNGAPQFPESGVVLEFIYEAIPVLGLFGAFHVGLLLGRVRVS